MPITGTRRTIQIEFILDFANAMCNVSVQVGYFVHWTKCKENVHMLTMIYSDIQISLTTNIGIPGLYGIFF
jgi:hypothetical protein